MALHDGAESLGRCIARFHDMKASELLETWARSGDLAKQYSGFAPLCRVAPDRALAVLPELPVANIAWLHGWFDDLYFANPQDTRVAVRTIMRRSPRDAAYCSQVYCQCAWRIDVETLETLLDALDSLLDLDECGELQGETALYRVLSLTARTATVEILARLAQMADGPLETKLANHAERWLAEDTHDAELRKVAAVLLRTGGIGLTRFINAQLRCPRQVTRWHGLEWAWFRPDAETRQLLKTIAESDELYERSTPKSPVLQREAIRSLAALGENRALVSAMLRHGADVSRTRYLRDGQLPITDDDIAPAIRVVQSGSDEERKRAFFAIGVSGRRDLIPFVKERFASTEPEGEERFGALWALCGLGADDDVSLAIFRECVANRRYRYPSMLALAQMNHEEARLILVDQLSRVDPSTAGTEEQWLVGVLAEFPGTRETALRSLWKSLHTKDNFNTMFLDSQLIEALGELDESPVQEYLLEESAPRETNFNVKGRRRAAIRALGLKDRNAAFEAAAAALRQARYDRELYPAALVEIDLKGAIPLLCRHFAQEASTAVQWSIGLALRNCGAPELVKLEMRSLLEGNADDQWGAATIIGWMGSGFLEDELQKGLESAQVAQVRRGWHWARSFHEQDSVGRQLLQRLVDCDRVRQATHLDGLFVSGQSKPATGAE